jgi:DNA-binding MarR family transcriptional regulator
MTTAARAAAAARRKPQGREAAAAEFHAPLEQSVGYLVRKLHRSFERRLAERLADHGILAAQWTVLRALWFEEGLSQVEIAERLRVERASLTHLLNGMEESGLITRSTDDADRRKLRIHLTARGRRLKRDLLPLGDEVNAAACDGFSKAEIATLRRMLLRLGANLAA